MSELMALEAYIVHLAAQYAWIIVGLLIPLAILAWQHTTGEMRK